MVMPSHEISYLTACHIVSLKIQFFCLDTNEYLEKTKNEINDYVNPYVIYNDTDFNWLIQLFILLGIVYIFLQAFRNFVCFLELMYVFLNLYIC